MVKFTTTYEEPNTLKRIDKDCVYINPNNVCYIEASGKECTYIYLNRDTIGIKVAGNIDEVARKLANDQNS